MSSPFVLIDDTNSSIHYSGPWFNVINTQIDTGSYGRPFQNTLHGVNVTAYFSFPFSGMSRVLTFSQALSLYDDRRFQDRRFLYLGRP
jgi:hypothetical protein